VELNKDFRIDTGFRYTGDGHYNTLRTPESMLGCVVCRSMCVISREMSGGAPTGRDRMISRPIVP